MLAPGSPKVWELLEQDTIFQDQGQGPKTQTFKANSGACINKLHPKINNMVTISRED